MIVLIVGNRFGSSFTEDCKHSITQAEHDAAFVSSLPIFAFIDEKVLHDHEIYRKVLEKHHGSPVEQKQLLAQIPFASQTDIRVFHFIDDIIRKVVNNGYFPFKNFQDIETSLKKQWSGMLFDFLKERKEKNTNQNMLNLLSQIEIATEKVEKIVGLLAEKTIPQDIVSLRSIDYVANEKRLHLVLMQIWNAFVLDAKATRILKRLPKEEIVKLRKILIEGGDIIDHNSLRKLLQRIGVVEHNRHFMHYLIDVRILELRKISEKNKILTDYIDKAIFETLFISVQNSKD
jgi:hypothetical protein